MPSGRACHAFLAASFTAVSCWAASPIQLTVSNQVDTSVGDNGRMGLYVSTAFQPAEWDNSFFLNLPAQVGTLSALEPQHINIQPVSQGLAQTGAQSWDFTVNNDVVPFVLQAGDHDPLYQLAFAPAFMMTNGTLAPDNFGTFADYSANIVRYFNANGFDAGGTHYQSQSPYYLNWFGIYNEPDINGISASDYVALYNTVVPEMQAVDPHIRFVALELSYQYDFVPAFVGGVRAPVDVVAVHFYGTCGAQMTDSQVFGNLNYFASGMGQPGGSITLPSLRSLMRQNPALATLPIWVTENNVDADYSNNGQSACNPGSAYVADTRATSPFYAAFFPLLFQYYAKDGIAGLNHWDYAADNTYGEVDGTTGSTYLSYWVDYWLSHFFPSSPGADILQVASSDQSGGTDVLAVRNDDGSVVLMVVNHQVASEADNNGGGVANTFSLDLSAIAGTFASITQVQIDRTTDPANGPAIQSTAFTTTPQISIPGYGVTFLKLETAVPTLASAGIVNATSYQSGSVAPGELVVLYGTGMGPAQLAFSDLNVPNFFDNSVAGAHVLFDGIPAPLVYVSAQQSVAIAPFRLAGQTTTQIQAEYLGSMSDPVTVPVASYLPGIFTADASGQGEAAALDVNYKPISVNNPVSAGGYVVLFVDGQGASDPNEVDGGISDGAQQYTVPVTVTIGGVSAYVGYAGRAPGEVYGVMQINVQVPAGVAPGAAPLEVTIGGVPAPTGVTLAIQ